MSDARVSSVDAGDKRGSSATYKEARSSSALGHRRDLRNSCLRMRNSGFLRSMVRFPGDA